MHSFLNTIGKLIREKNLPALMIGGHAVTALGHPRATFDLDLLIPKSAAATWEAELEKLSYTPYAQTKVFHQYEAYPGFSFPPIDLMLVDDQVFETLSLGKTEPKPIATPSATSIIALKLHAINQPAREDTAQDWSDIIALTKAHNLSLDDPEFFAIIQKYGGETAIQKIKDSLLNGN